MQSNINVLPGKLSETIEKTIDEQNQVVFNTNLYTDSDEARLTEEEQENLETRQIQTLNASVGGAGKVKEPPTELSLEELVELSDLNARLSRSIETLALNTVGLGWDIEVKDGVKNSDKFDEAKRQQRLVESRLHYPHPEKNFSTIMRKAKNDEETIGNGYIEVNRDMKGEIRKFHNIIGHSIRVRQNPDKGFKQDLNTDERYFKKFGDMKIMDSKSGEFADPEEELDNDDENDGPVEPDSVNIPFEQQATELVHLKKHSTKSRFYGIPQWIPSIPSVVGNRKAAERNVNFFDNDGVPRMMVQVEGGRLTDKSQEEITNFIRQEHKGIENAHRVMVLEAVDQEKEIGPGGGGPFAQGGGRNSASINLEPLTVGMDEDASFLEYRKANDEEIREIFGISEAFFSTADVNRSSAEVSRAITNQQIFEPDRKEKQFLINNTIIRDIVLRDKLPDNLKSRELDDPEVQKELEDEEVLVKLKFESPEIGNPEKEQAEILKLYSDMALLTINEMREIIGKDPYPDEFEFGKKPLEIALAEFQAGISLPIDAGADAPENPNKQPGASEAGDNDEEPDDTTGDQGSRSNNSNRGSSNSTQERIKNFANLDIGDHVNTNRLSKLLDEDIDENDVRRAIKLKEVLADITELT